MTKRHSDAIAIQDGACNPSGIAHSIIAAIAELRADPGTASTAAICGDSAVRLMVHQLAFICGVTNGIEDMAKGKPYSDCVAECRGAGQ